MNKEVIYPYLIFIVSILVSTVPSALATRSDSYIIVWLSNSVSLICSIGGSLYAYHYLMLVTHKAAYQQVPQTEPFLNKDKVNDQTLDMKPPGTVVWE
jgi:hypothetical protein